MLEKISEMIREQLHLSETTVITESTNFKDDLRADSLELAELVWALEDEYGIKFEDEDLEKMQTVGDFIEFLQNKGIDL